MGNKKTHEHSINIVLTFKFKHPAGQNMFSANNISLAKSFLSTAASLAASAMLVRSVSREFLPYEVESYIFSGIRKLITRVFGTHQFITMVFEEYDGLVHNEIYEAAVLYLGSKLSPSTQRLKVSKPEKEKSFSVTMDQNEEILDVFDGVQFKWRLVTKLQARESTRHSNLPPPPTESRSLILSFHMKHKEKVLNSYLHYILEKSESIKVENKTLKIFKFNYNGMYRNYGDAWCSTNFYHAATFETLAMDTELKKTIMEDLERFVERKDFYRKVGKAWKRGYLLYGPPGTGKSSLIAAMANYLKFDIFDMDISGLHCDSDLSSMLLGVSNRSILVVEDIDCTVLQFQDRQTIDPEPAYGSRRQVTLSGFLNVMDGLWSGAGDERIIVFTTNHKEKLDPALLRPGRMDMHILMSYCTPCGFMALASNYLGIDKDDDDDLLEEIQQLIVKVEVTPAEVAEELMRGDNPELVLRGLTAFLKNKVTLKNENSDSHVSHVTTELGRINTIRRVGLRGGLRRSGLRRIIRRQW